VYVYDSYLKKNYAPFLFLLKRIRDSYSVDATGIAMLFSAGTFLFVATVHVLPEVQSHNDDRQFRAIELLILIIGCCFPVILTMGHKH
jgi:zinc transporter 9